MAIFRYIKVDVVLIKFPSNHKKFIKKKKMESIFSVLNVLLLLSFINLGEKIYFEIIVTYTRLLD